MIGWKLPHCLWCSPADPSRTHPFTTPSRSSPRPAPAPGFSSQFMRCGSSLNLLSTETNSPISVLPCHILLVHAGTQSSPSLSGNTCFMISFSLYLPRCSRFYGPAFDHEPSFVGIWDSSASVVLRSLSRDVLSDFDPMLMNKVSLLGPPAVTCYIRRS
jgi:hypothetical protein